MVVDLLAEQTATRAARSSPPPPVKTAHTGPARRAGCATPHWTPSIPNTSCSSPARSRDDFARSLSGRSRPAIPPCPELPGRVGRRRQSQGNLTRDLGDRAGGRFPPPDGHPSTTSSVTAPTRNCPRLADGSLRPQDPAGNRRPAWSADASIKKIAAAARPVYYFGPRFRDNVSNRNEASGPHGE